MTVALAWGASTPAPAQGTLIAGIESDYRYRGRSLSGGHPAATVTFAYDHVSGLYGAASGAALFDPDPGLLAVRGNIGFATRLGDRLSVDAGIMHTQFTSRYTSGNTAHLTEFYVGATRGNISARAYYSPDYFGRGTDALYSEAEAVADLGSGFRLNGHLGLLHYFDRLPFVRQTQHDWAASLARGFGTTELHVTLSGSSPVFRYDGRQRNRGTALVVGASHAF